MSVASDAALFMVGLDAKQMIWTPSSSSPSVGQGPFASQCLLDMPSKTILGGEIVTTSYQVTYATADFPGWDSDELISIAGIPYRVQVPTYLADGVFSAATLEQTT